MAIHGDLLLQKLQPVFQLVPFVNLARQTPVDTICHLAVLRTKLVPGTKVSYKTLTLVHVY